MRYVAIGPIAALTIGLSPLFAQPPSETHEQAALELLQTMNVERTMMGGASAMADAMIQNNAQLSPFRDVILKWAGTVLTWENFGPKLVALYAGSFTESELRDITAFYKTPTGQKALTLMPEMMRRSAMLGNDVAKEHAPELERMVRERAVELESKAPKP